MKLFISYIILIIFIQFLIKDEVPSSFAKNTENIQSDTILVTDTERIKLKTFDIRTLPEKHIINDSAHYYELLKYRYWYDSLYTKLPYIDFSKRTLLGYEVLGRFGTTKATIYYINSLQKYLFYVEHQDTVLYDLGLCNQLWFTIPKLQSGYTVEFKYHLIPYTDVRDINERQIKALNFSSIDLFFNFLNLISNSNYYWQVEIYNLQGLLLYKSSDLLNIAEKTIDMNSERILFYKFTCNGKNYTGKILNLK